MAVLILYILVDRVSLYLFMYVTLLFRHFFTHVKLVNTAHNVLYEIRSNCEVS